MTFMTHIIPRLSLWWRSIQSFV